MQSPTVRFFRKGDFVGWGAKLEFLFPYRSCILSMHCKKFGFLWAKKATHVNWGRSERKSDGRIVEKREQRTPSAVATMVYLFFIDWLSLFSFGLRLFQLLRWYLKASHDKHAAFWVKKS